MGWYNILCSRIECKERFCNDERSVFTFISVLDMQDVFNCFCSKQLRRTAVQDENQQGVQARHT